MAVTDYSSQITALQTAIATGARSISYEGKTVSYASLDEMLKTVAYLNRLQAAANGQPVATVGLGSFDRGYRRRGAGWGNGDGGGGSCGL